MATKKYDKFQKAKKKKKKKKKGNRIRIHTNRIRIGFDCERECRLEESAALTEQRRRRPVVEHAAPVGLAGRAEAQKDLLAVCLHANRVEARRIRPPM
jgi:hypothetical protein